MQLKGYFTKINTSWFYTTLHCVYSSSFSFSSLKAFFSVEKQVVGRFKEAFEKTKGFSKKEDKVLSIYGVTMLWTLYEICLWRIQIQLAWMQNQWSLPLFKWLLGLLLWPWIIPEKQNEIQTSSLPCVCIQHFSAQSTNIPHQSTNKRYNEMKLIMHSWMGCTNITTAVHILGVSAFILVILTVAKYDEHMCATFSLKSLPIIIHLEWLLSQNLTSQWMKTACRCLSF